MMGGEQRKGKISQSGMCLIMKNSLKRKPTAMLKLKIDKNVVSYMWSALEVLLLMGSRKMRGYFCLCWVGRGGGDYMYIKWVC